MTRDLFLLAACQYPAGMLDRTPQSKLGAAAHDEPATAALQRWSGPAFAARRRMRERFDRRRPHPTALLWAGDRIYIDATAGLLDPLAGLGPPPARPGPVPSTATDPQYLALVRAYQAVEGQWPYPMQMEKDLHVGLDDHEIVDNWEPSADPARQEALQRLGDVGIAAHLQMRPQQSRGTALWGARTFLGGWPLFTIDSRTERSVRSPATLGTARLIGNAQWQALQQWLRQPVAGPRRLLLSPAILLPRRLTTAEHPAGALRSDAWDGYPASLHDLLATLADEQVHGCVFLSGDEHLACVVRAEVWREGGADRKVRFWSVHTGAMYAPYPFANGRPEHFADEREFGFASAASGSDARYRCRLERRFGPPDTDGFVGVELDRAAHPGDDLRVRFHGADGVDYGLLP